MSNTASPKTLAAAAKHLCDNDPVLEPIIKHFGRCTIEPHHNYYQALVDSIIGQQLSVKAAHTIRGRFYDLFDGNKLPKPKDILSMPTDKLRAAGLSYAKAGYVQDLALHILDNKLNFDTIDKLQNQDVIITLTAVKGVGEWTAHMFMMFCMGRLDILPVGDLGIRNGIMKLYGLNDLPSPEQIREIAVKCSWHPYETVASWYIWQSLDNKSKKLEL